MIDAPGPWGTGPFTVVEGYSRLDSEQVVINEQPFAATFLWREERTPRVRLVANQRYWDTSRGPKLREIIFRNDLTPEQALELVCSTQGEVDIVSELQPADAERVENSEHAKLVTIDAVRIIAGMINRDAESLPLADLRARQALNLAIDRDALVRETMYGYAAPLAGLTPPSAIPVFDRVLHPLFAPYPHNAKRARELWRQAGGTIGLRLRIAAPAKLEPVARRVAADLEAALDVHAELLVYRSHEEVLEARRRLAQRTLPRDWDLLIWEHGAQAADGPPMELHRAFVGAHGEYNAGPAVPDFEALYAELQAETSQLKQVEISHRIDKFVHDQALALFLCAPHALYAVNKHVEFTPYRTTLEFAECSVDGRHWSR